VRGRDDRRCWEVGDDGCAEELGLPRDWGEVLAVAAAIRRLGDVEGFSGLYQVRGANDEVRRYVVEGA
jgi:hypothetical protein